MTPPVISRRFARREHWRRGDPLEQYVWDTRYIDAPALSWHDSDTDGTVDDTLYVMNDANYNVTGLVDATTGDVVERYIFTPYGERTVLEADWAPVSGRGNVHVAFGQRRRGENVLFLQRKPLQKATLGLYLGWQCRKLED